MRHEYTVWLRKVLTTTESNGDTHSTNALTTHSIADAEALMEKHDGTHYSKCQYRLYKGKMRWVIVWTVLNPKYGVNND